jgi:hypothetical protein
MYARKAHHPLRAFTIKQTIHSPSGVKDLIGEIAEAVFVLAQEPGTKHTRAYDKMNGILMDAWEKLERLIK